MSQDGEKPTAWEVATMRIETLEKSVANLRTAKSRLKTP